MRRREDPRHPLPVLHLGSRSPIPDAWLAGRQRLADRRPQWGHRQPIDTRTLWCACPDCGCPQSVRCWLMMADCWSCGATFVVARSDVRRAARRAPGVRSRDETADAAAVVPVWRRAAPTALPGGRQRIGRARRRDWLSFLPAWLVSLMLHLLVLLALALWVVQRPQEPDRIELSVRVSQWERPGGVSRHVVQAVEAFDLPDEGGPTGESAARQDALRRADEMARQIRMDPDQFDRHLPALAEVQRRLHRDDPARMFLARDPRLRARMVTQHGGTTWTEAAVAQGLLWLAQHQRSDGRWSLRRFPDANACQGQCDGTGRLSSETAATALSLLAFLGAGQTQQTGMYRERVHMGLQWLMERQRSDGDLRGDSHQQAAMYAHAQATIVLCEAWAMTGDSQLRAPAQAAIDFLCDAQHPQGGWRYRPGQPGDTSVLGWQWMALQSARAGGLTVARRTLDNAARYLDAAQCADAVHYAYQPGKGPSHVMTAEAILCRLYQGWHPQRPEVQLALADLVEHHPPEERRPNVYYWYYATQALHHAGGPLWPKWNERLRRVLVAMQRQDGHLAGSWDPRGPHAAGGGRIYTTALSICTLEVYYRHAPLYASRSRNRRTARK